MVMGCVDRELMLDSSILSFVEPLGPAQVVDRQSLVDLPQGYLKVGFETQPRRLLLRIHAFRQHLSRREKHPLRTTIRSFYSIRNHVLEGKASNAPTGSEAVDITHIFDKAVMERLAFGEKGVQPEVQEREMIQICVHRGRNRAFLGFVHVAVDDLLNHACDQGATHGWYKIFARSSFNPGCPIACITPHCINPCPKIDPEFSQRMSKRSTCPAALHSSNETRQQEPQDNKRASSVSRLSTYTRVVGVCQALKRRVHVKKTHADAAVPVTIDLKGPETTAISASSSSSDIGYASGGSSHTAPDGIPSPTLLSVSLNPEFGLIRRLSTRTQSVSKRASLRRNRRISFNFGDTLRLSQSEAKPTSTIRRSVEVIASNTSERFSSASGSSSSSSRSGSQRRLAFCESEPKIFRTTSTQEETMESYNARTDKDFNQQVQNDFDAKVDKCKPLANRSASLGSETITKKEESVVKGRTPSFDSKVVRKQSLKKLMRGLSLRRKDGNSKQSGSSFSPTSSCVDESDDNVYEVLLSLKKMSVDRTSSGVGRPTSIVLGRQLSENSSSAPPVDEITVETPPVEAESARVELHLAHKNNNQCSKKCKRRGNLKLLRHTREVTCDVTAAASLPLDSCRVKRGSTSKRQSCETESPNQSFHEDAECVSDDDDDYVSCNDNVCSNASSYVSLREADAVVHTSSGFSPAL